MKWALGILLGLNAIVFLMAMFANDGGSGDSTTTLPEGVKPITLLAQTNRQVGSVCFNLGPVDPDIATGEIGPLLGEQNITARLLTEPARTVSAFRVLMSPESDEQIATMGEQLKRAGIESYYQTRSKTGETILSIGVFTYEKTAQDLAASLANNGLAASYAHESLEYPQRYWLNLDAELDERVFRQVRNKTGSDELFQTPASCVHSAPAIQSPGPEPLGTTGLAEKSTLEP